MKITLARGAHVADPQKVFNNGLGGKEWRALDLLEGDLVGEKAVKALIRAAVAFNRSEQAAKASSKRRPGASRTSGTHRAGRQSTESAARGGRRAQVALGARGRDGAPS